MSHLSESGWGNCVWGTGAPLVCLQRSKMTGWQLPCVRSVGWREDQAAGKYGLVPASIAIHIRERLPLHA